MTTVGGQFGVVPGPDEAALLAWVEGTATHAEAEVVRAALAADPALHTLLEAMKADRARLEQLGDLAPPPGLVAGALARYDAAMSPELDPRVLSGIAGNEVHEVRVAHSMSRPRTLWNRERGLLAAAAAVALASGLAWWGMQPTSVSRMKGTGVVAGIDDHTHNAGINENPGLAVNAPEGARPGESLMHGSDLVRGGEPAGETVRMLAFDQPPPVPLILARTTQDPTERWIRAAREGRLAVRVTARRADTADVSLSALIANNSPSRPWRMTDRVPDAVKIALAKPPPPAVAPRENEPITLASDSTSRRYSPAQTPLRAPSPAVAVLPPTATDLVCVGAFSPTPAGLEALRGALIEQVGVVSFVELSTPLVASSEPAAQTPESVLWWTQPASRWTAWVEVPVIVER